MEEILQILSQGEIKPYGLVSWSSNYTFLAKIIAQAGELTAVYKPSRGMQPLWDFDVDTLCFREVAAYRLGIFLGWPAIPPVILREGPYGIGSVQLFIEHDPHIHYFTLRDDTHHASTFQRVALFDYLANNADRKGGHLLQDTARGQIWAIDHGLTFHTNYKLRTVIWEHAGQPIPDDCLASIQALYDILGTANSPLATALNELLTTDEVKATRERAGKLLQTRKFPRPHPSWHNVPYPLI